MSTNQPERATPETDAHTHFVGSGMTGHNRTMVEADLARSLERRLAAARAEVERQSKHIRDLQGLFRAENKHAIELATAGEKLATEFAECRAQLATAKEERDEAIKAHGVVWNAVRKAASALRWLDIPNNHVALKEDAEAINEAEKLKPRWSTDWAIIGKCEFATLRSDLAKANAAVEAEKEAADKWREYYRKAYGHPWENRNSNYQGL